MIGAIAGDIIGSIYEHERIKTTDFPLFGFGCRFTDDTVLTVAVADAILRGKSYAEEFENYYYRFPNAGYGSNFEAWARSHDHKPYNSWGNGSAMRVSPVGLAFQTLEETLAEAKRSAEVTHNHTEGIRGAQIIAAALFRIRCGKRKHEVADFIASDFGCLTDEPIESVRKWYKFDVSCRGTVPYAVRAFLEGRTYEETIRLAISLGGDSDTLACIAGSLADAYYGVPLEIVTEVRRRVPDGLLKVVDAFCKKHWPPPRSEYLQTKFIVKGEPAVLPSEFSIITAFNPDGKNTSTHENVRLHHRLTDEVTKRNLASWSVTGCSPDLKHQEQGLGIIVDLENALKIGRAFRQEAVYFVEGGRLFLVNCTSGSRHLMGDWKERWA